MSKRPKQKLFPPVKYQDQDEDTATGQDKSGQVAETLNVMLDFWFIRKSVN